MRNYIVLTFLYSESNAVVDIPTKLIKKHNQFYISIDNQCND